MLAGVNLVCALLAYSFLAYTLARFRWHGRGILLVLVAIIISAQVWLIPQLITTFVLRVNTTLYWIWFADWSVGAFSIVLLWHSLKDSSRDRADAARMDGCGPFGVYWHIVLPLVRQALFLLAIFNLMASAADLLADGLEIDRVGLLHIIHPTLFLLIFSSALMTIPLIAIFLWQKS
jgi:multiple sugar transport system permease protein